MTQSLLTLSLADETDVLACLEQARHFSRQINFPEAAQARIALAVVEAAHAAFEQAQPGGIAVEFLLEKKNFTIRFSGKVTEERGDDSLLKLPLSARAMDIVDAHIQAGAVRIILKKNIPVASAVEAVEPLKLPARRVDERERFLSHMSHEFRTPVNSALRLTEFLLDRVDGPLTVEQEKQVRLIRKSMEYLSVMVNDLLDLAKLQAGKEPVRPEEFSISELFTALDEMIRPLHANPKVLLKFPKKLSIPPMRADKEKVAQILGNFISNALKYTEQGEVRVSVKYNAEKQQVTFAVRDTGIGIPSESSESIFEEFSQLDNPLQKQKKGTGLGLPLSRRLAQLLGGRVEVKSRIAEGSIFSLMLPLRCEEEGESHASMPGPQAKILLKEVLLIDHDEASCYALKRALATQDCVIYEARDCESGLRIAREQSPSIIFLDLALPDINGFEMLDCLKAIAATRDIPVVVYSAKPLSIQEVDKLKPLTFDIISKGMAYEDLLQYIGRVAALLPERRIA